MPSAHLIIDRPWTGSDKHQGGRDCGEEHGNPPTRSRYQAPEFDERDDSADCRRPQATQEQKRCPGFDEVRAGIARQDSRCDRCPQKEEAHGEPVTDNLHNQRSHCPWPEHSGRLRRLGPRTGVHSASFEAPLRPRGGSRWTRPGRTPAPSGPSPPLDRSGAGDRHGRQCRSEGRRV